MSPFALRLVPNSLAAHILSIALPILPTSSTARFRSATKDHRVVRRRTEIHSAGVVSGQVASSSGYIRDSNLSKSMREAPVSLIGSLHSPSLPERYFSANTGECASKERRKTR